MDPAITWKMRPFLGAAERKLKMARRLLDAFVHEEATLPEDLFVQGRWDETLMAEAHADGVVFELGAAFDAFACALSHRYTFIDPNNAEFNGDLVRGLEAIDEAETTALASEVRAIRKSREFWRLREYRNLAAHRDLLARKIVLTTEGKFFPAFDSPAQYGPDVVHLRTRLEELCAWAERCLPPLIVRARDELD